MYNGPLWFLQNLLMLYLIYPIINITYNNNKKVYYYLFGIVTFFTFIGGFLTSINNLHILNVENISTFINNIDPIKNGVFIFYFILGGVLYDKREMLNIKKNRIVLLVVGIIIYILSVLFTVYIFMYKNITFTSNYLYSRFPLAIIICAMFVIVYNYKSKEKFYNKIIKSIGENTLGIFLMHVPLKLVLETFNIIKYNSLINRIFAFLLVFIISYGLTIIIKKIPYINKIIKI